MSAEWIQTYRKQKISLERHTAAIDHKLIWQLDPRPHSHVAVVNHLDGGSSIVKVDCGQVTLIAKERTREYAVGYAAAAYQFAGFKTVEVHLPDGHAPELYAEYLAGIREERELEMLF